MRIYGSKEEPTKVFGKGTRVRLIRDMTVSRPLPEGIIKKVVVKKGQTGTIKSVFPYRLIHMDDGSELKLHQSIKLIDELEIISEQAKLRIVKAD